MVWTKLKVTRGSKEIKVFLSKGKSLYVKFTSSLVQTYNLNKKKSVDIYVDKIAEKICVGFSFRDDKKGLLKFNVNDREQGFVSGASLFKELAAKGIPRNNFSEEGYLLSREEEMDKNKLLVIELKKD